MNVCLADIQWGYLLLNSRKEVIVVSDSVLKAFPPANAKPVASDAAAVPEKPLVLSRKAFEQAKAEVIVADGRKAVKEVAIINALAQLGKLPLARCIDN